MEALQLARNYLKNKNAEISTPFRLNTQIEYAEHKPIRAHLSLTDAVNDITAQLTIEMATHSPALKFTDMTHKQLHNCIVLQPPTASDALLPLIAYFGLRLARIWHCQNVIFLNKNEMIQKNLSQSLNLEPLPLFPTVYAQRLEYSIHLAYEQCDTAQRHFIQTHFVYEILDTFETWCKDLFQGSWFSAIHSQTISKEQYIASLFNLHQFVKHTTRLAARCVAMCEQRDLRNHYIHHLKGEINHEVIIESDLKALRADVNYLLHSHVPHTATAAFIVLQESITGYKRDAVLMLACPFIAEGMTANINNNFVENLFSTIRSWGVKSPESVSRFLTSHMKTDGGDDGHWLRVIMMIDKHIQNEKQMQEFNNALRLAMSSYAHGLNANIDDMALWHTTAAVGVQ